MQSIRRGTIGLVLLFLSHGLCSAGDWPNWRFDAGHTAASPDPLPDNLQLNWTRYYSPRIQVWDDPLNHDMMQYDRIFEPVVKDGRLFVNFNDADKVVALDVATGDELWTHYAEGPVRFPAVAWRDVVFFASDDGNLYCVNASDGKLKWKFFGAPAQRKAVGNGRVVSAWPARGGPVVHDDHIYFANSIWPFMGTYIWCLDADSGEIKWVNDSTANDYIKQPHSAPSFAGVAPQGGLVVVGDYLMVPGGRSVPAALDRHTGELKHFLMNEGGKGNGGSLVLGRGDEFFVHTRDREVRSFELVSGNKTAFVTNEPVLDESLIFASEIKEVKQDESSDAVERISVIRAYRADTKEQVWEVENIDGSGDIIKAGERLYVAGRDQLTALQLHDGEQPAEPIWSTPVEFDVLRLLAANDRLFAVTEDGAILCYGPADEAREIEPESVLRPTSAQTDELADELIGAADAQQGYALIFGAVDSSLLDSLIARSELRLVVIDENESRVHQLRREYDRSGLQGTRITFHVGTIDSYGAPPYIARLVLLAESAAQAARTDQALLRKAYDSVRPYGGYLAVVGARESGAAEWSETLQAANLEKALVGTLSSLPAARRIGALTGAADWTHQYGNVANTVKSNDSRLRLPLGVLWFGGSSNLDVLPRHGHGPPEQVIGGRLYIEGMNSLSCRDVYTGQVLWKRTFGDLGTYGIYFDDTYKDTPLDPAYNQVHIPGANGRGTNYVATEDAIYLVEDDKCHVLDPETGETLREIKLPPAVTEEGRKWGFIGVYEDVLLGGTGFANYQKRHSLSFADSDKEFSGNSKGYGSASLETAASRGLIAFNRHTGEVLWTVDANHSFVHNGVVAGDDKVFCLDKLPKLVEDRLRRRGIEAPDTYRIIALDYRTGELLWEQTDRIFGTWLGYSEPHQLLLHAGAAASDRLKSEVGQGMAVYRGQSGDVVWRVEDRAYSGPCIIHNETIITNVNSYSLSAGAFNLLDGSPRLVSNPLTQEEQEWQFCRTYGCNSIVASENLLTFRSGAAGFYDLESRSGTGNLGGFKSGCTSNLIVANGVLNAPDYTRTCSCGYQNQTSLALVHMPEMDLWTVNDVARLSTPGQAIQRVGVNFGAPGDRMDSNGTLWIDYPTVGGESVDLKIELSGAAEYFDRNTLAFGGKGLPWVAASGVEGVQTIQIPLAIDGAPNELQIRVNQGNDDAEEKNEDGSIDLASSDLELIDDRGAQTVGVRFDNVMIPRNRKVESAYIQFACDEATSDPTKVFIRVEDTDHADSYANTPHNISSRAVLEPTVEWVVPEWGQVDRVSGRERTPDLAALVQDIVNRPNWEAGNAIGFVISGEGKRVAKSQNGSATHAPLLEVTIEADPRPVPPATAHTVRLQFAEPEAIEVGQRVFDVMIGDQLVQSDLDIIREAGDPRQTVVLEFRDIMLSDQLSITFNPKVGKPLINGVEVIRQD